MKSEDRGSATEPVGTATPRWFWALVVTQLAALALFFVGYFSGPVPLAVVCVAGLLIVGGLCFALVSAVRTERAAPPRDVR